MYLLLLVYLQNNDRIFRQALNLSYNSDKSKIIINDFMTNIVFHKEFAFKG
jgi:hypothetical protein